jgi:PAS domain S-box-containing protein
MTSNLLRAIFNSLPRRDTLAAREVLRALLDSTTDGVIVVGLDSKVIAYSPAAAEMWGFPRGLPDYKDARDLQRAIMDQVRDPAAYEALIRDATAAPAQSRTDAVELKDGRVFEQRIRPLTKDERPFAIAYTFRDISTEAACARARREAEQRVAVYYKYVPVLTFTWQHTADGFVLTDCNEAALRRFAGRASSVLGRSAREEYEDRPDIVEDLAACHREQKVINRETLYKLRASGRDGWFGVTFAPTPPDLVTVFAKDITALKNAEEAVRASELLFAEMFGAAPLALAIVRVSDGQIVDVNEALLAMLGYSRDEVIGRTSDELGLIDPASRREANATLQREGLVRDLPMAPRSKSGERRTVLATLVLLDIGGEARVLATAKDITEQRKAEGALVESVRLFGEAFGAAPMGLAIARVSDRQLVDVNETFLTSLRFTRDEVIGRTTDELGIVDPAARREAIEKLQREGVVREWPMTVCTKWGESRDILATLVMIELAGEPHTLSITRDITGEKKNEDALLASGRLFTRVFAASPLPIVITRLSDGHILDANEAFLSLMGYKREEVRGRTSIELGMADPRERGEALDEVRTKGILRDVPLTGRTKSGEVREVLTALTLIEFEGDACVLSISQDVTERNRARDELESAVERKLRQNNPYSLTVRELTVLHLIVAGRSDKQVASGLSISPLTVHKHVANILAKMNASSRTEAGVRALRDGLLD